MMTSIVTLILNWKHCKVSKNMTNSYLELSGNWWDRTNYPNILERQYLRNLYCFCTGESSFLYQPVSYIFQGPPLYSRRASWSGKSNSDHHDGAAYWQITISITFDSPCVLQSRFFVFLFICWYHDNVHIRVKKECEEKQWTLKTAHSILFKSLNKKIFTRCIKKKKSL